MRSTLYGLLILLTLCCLACGGENATTDHSGKNYIIDEWIVDNQTIQFRSDSTMMVVARRAEGVLDTTMAYYSYQPDSTPIQLDMHIYTGAISGMHLFGIVDPIHSDTFLLTTNKGFEGQGKKYRPNTFENAKVVTYVRSK